MMTEWAIVVLVDMLLAGINLHFYIGHYKMRWSWVNLVAALYIFTVGLHFALL